MAAECQTDTPSASDVACSRIAAKFMQITGRDLASKFVTFPCASVEGFFAAVLAGQVPLQRCEKSEAATRVYDGDEPDDLVAFSFDAEGQWICGFVDVGLVLPISPEQGQFCAQLLEQAANSQGLTCEAP